jgi:hypothetical protein
LTFYNSTPNNGRFSGSLEIFIGFNHTLYRRNEMAISWHPWNVVPSFNIIINVPSVVSTEANHRDFFFRGSDNFLHHANFSLTNGTWKQNGTTEIIGKKMKIQGTPTAVTGGPNSIDVFARGEDNRLYHIRREYGKTEWYPEWDNLGGEVTTSVLNESPAAAASGGAPAGRLDVFIRSGSDHHLSTLHWKSGESGWSNLSPLGGNVMSAPTATSNGANLLDVFAILNDGRINHISSADGKTWSGWDDLGGVGKGSFNEAPIAVSTSGRLDVFARNADNNHLWHAQWQKDVTPGWRVADADLGGLLTSAPSAFSSAANHIDCFAQINNTFEYRYWGS